MKKKLTRPKSFVVWLGDQIKKNDRRISKLELELRLKDGLENYELRCEIEEQIVDVKKMRDDHEALYYQATGHRYDDIPF